MTVLTAMPNYPRGTIFGDYRGKLIATESRDGVRVLRAWIYARPRHSFMARMLSYGSFVLTSFLLALLKAGPQDIIVTESPPLFLGASGLLLSKIKGARHVLNVSDLWPESAVAMGVVKNRLLIRLAVQLEELLYRRSDLITGQTRGIVADILPRSRGVPVALITNGVDIAEFNTHARKLWRSEMRNEFGLGEQFVIGYFGLHGLAQGLSSVHRAAKLLQSYRHILFVFFGDGPEKAALIRTAEAAGLQNIRFYPPEPVQRIPALLAAVDASVVPLRNLPLFMGALPSKLFTSMAAGVPVLLAAKGEAADIVLRSRAGVCVEPENAHQIAEAVLHLSRDAQLCRQFGANGTRLVRHEYDQRRIVAGFEQLLQGLVALRPATQLHEEEAEPKGFCPPSPPKLTPRLPGSQ